MAIAVIMPQLGESVVEGTVTRWLKAPGDAVAKFEPLLEIATDKIDTEVPAPADGIVLALLVAAGETVHAGAVLAYIGAPDEAVPETVRSASLRQGAPVQPPMPAPMATDQPAEHPSGRSFISPVVAHIAAEHGVDLAQVPGSGLGGRITKQDILAFVEAHRAAQLPVNTPPPAPLPLTILAPDTAELAHPLTTMRRAIARHMVQSKQASPHVTTVFEVDMTAVVRHRERNKRAFGEKGAALTYMPYFVAAAAAGLKAVPALNSRFSEEAIVERLQIHIGMAVAVNDGLLVPVIRQADEKNLLGLARSVNDLAARARANQLAPDELTGGTFTITNHGTGGSLLATPIINQPQAGILGIGAIVKRPVVHSSSPSLLPSADDAIVIRPMCYLSLTFDHRVLDGAQADAFLRVVKETLENWRIE